VTARQRRIVRPIEPSTAHPRVGSDSVARSYTINQRNAVRSPQLLEALARLDTRTSATARRELMEWVKDEYAARGGGELIGLMAKCYLGPPYVDHTLDLSGLIIEHYSPRDPVPDGLDSARPVAQSGAYLYIEVYSDGMIVPVREDGRSAV
jgi:hypothetical protein